MTQTERQQGRKTRKLRSSTVVLGSMGALAAALSGCASEPDKRCVDKDSYDAVRGYKTLSASQCESGAAGNRAAAKPASSAAQASTAVHASTATHASTAGASTAARTAARSTEPRWYYDGETDGRRAHDGTFDHNLAVERGGFGCDDDDSDSSGTSGG